MRLPIQRIDTYTHPVSGTVAFDIRVHVESELRARIPDLTADALFEVTAEPRGTYTGVSVFVQPERLEKTFETAKTLENDLDAAGVRVLINVRTWTNANA